jgi:hypothetical protein
MSISRKCITNLQFVDKLPSINRDVFYNNMPPGCKIYIVFGHTQHGKSSFINMLSCSYSQPIGSNYGHSCTGEITPIRFKDFFNILETPEMELIVIGTPGLGDTEMRFFPIGKYLKR